MGDSDPTKTLSEKLTAQHVATWTNVKVKWNQINGKKITIIAEGKEKKGDLYFATVHKDVFALETLEILHPGYAKSNVTATFTVCRKNNENPSVYLKKASYNFKESDGKNVFAINNKNETYLCKLGGEGSTLEIVPEYNQIEAIDIRAKSDINPSYFKNNVRQVSDNEVAVIFCNISTLTPTEEKAAASGTPTGKHSAPRNTSFATVAVPLEHAQQIQKEAITLEKFNFDGGFSAEFFSSEPFTVEIELTFSYPDGKPKNPDYGQRTLFQDKQKETDIELLEELMYTPKFEKVTFIKEGETKTLKQKNSVGSRTPKHLKSLGQYKGLFQSISTVYSTSEEFEAHLTSGNATNKELFEHLQHFFGVSIFFYQKSNSTESISEVANKTSPDDIIHGIDVWLNEIWLCFQNPGTMTEEDEKLLNSKFKEYFNRHSFEKMTNSSDNFNPLKIEDPSSFLIHLLTTEMESKIMSNRKEFKKQNLLPVQV